MKEKRATIKRPNTGIHQPSPTSAVEAHMGEPDKGGSKSLMMLNADNKINLLQQTSKIIVYPPTQIISKADTREKAHYFTQANANALVDFQKRNGSPG